MLRRTKVILLLGLLLCASLFVGFFDPILSRDLNWMDALVAAAIILIGVFSIARAIAVDARLARRFFTGRCVHCGYDLQGGLQTTCPECGREQPAKQSP
jgi:hypothetical protein